MVLAFSLQSDVKSIGAYAGFAAIIGLALLVLLYFAQAREIRRLSDWLEQQEDRLRNLPARAPLPRPVPTAPAARVAAAPAAVAAEAGAAPTATVAVPGVRRVAVRPAGAVAPVAAAGQAEGAAGAAEGAAAVAGALAPASAAGRAASESSDETDDTVPPNRVRAPGAVQGGPDPGEATPSPAVGAGEGPAPTAEGAPGSAIPSAAVPLTSRPAPTAEPAASAFGADAGGSGSSGENAESMTIGPPAAEAGTVATLEAGEGVVARLPPAQSEANAPFASGGAVEISAGRVASPPPDASPSPPLFDGQLEGTPPSAAPDVDAEPPVLRPSTPAGARPRFPPPPPAPAVRATPVGVTARAPVAAVAAAAGGAATVAADTAATTRRRERDPAPGDGADNGESHGRGSALRLLAAAIVIVLVLVFIATKVFAPAKTTGLIPSKVVVAVLNGTHVGGLAGKAAVKLSAGGFLRGGVANALSQGHHVTLVSYTPGNLAAAKLVAKDLIPTRTLVGPVDSRTAALADSLGATAPNVIVTLGSDYLPQ
jgi:hypothetical protein